MDNVGVVSEHLEEISSTDFSSRRSEEKMEALPCKPVYECLLFGESVKVFFPYFSISYNFYLSSSSSSLFHGLSLSLSRNSPDLDDTLYPLSLGINSACRKNIEGKLSIVPT